MKRMFWGLFGWQMHWFKLVCVETDARLDLWAWCGWWEESKKTALLNKLEQLKSEGWKIVPPSYD